MIFGANIELELITVHLSDEDQLFFQVPLQNDGSENWQRLQAWIDEGNQVGGQIVDLTQYAIDQRRVSYPSWQEQLDYIYHNGIEAWKSNVIDPIKEKYPKPTE